MRREKTHGGGLKALFNLQLSRVSLRPADLLTLVKNPSTSKPEDIYNTTYTVQDNGTIIRSGIINRNTSIIFPATDTFSLTINDVTISGKDILAQDPTLKTWSQLEKLLLQTIFYSSIAAFILGTVTEFWNIVDLFITTKTSVITHTSIYWPIRQMFGRNVAAMIAGQFRDFGAYIAAFAGLFLFDEKFVRGLKIGIALFIVSVFPLLSFWFTLEKSKLQGGVIDTNDIMVYSILPVTFSIYALHKLINYLRRPKIPPAEQIENKPTQG